MFENLIVLVVTTSRRSPASQLPAHARPSRGTVSALALTFVLQGCGTSAPVSADGPRRVVGTDLTGERSATSEDQRKIDRTVVGICAAAVWTTAECARHGEA
ncbi:hypothetical protein GOD41_17005 [Sinorhizobium medicae]|nr:hypothetical protein [Sinorhizobium medicae]